MSKLSELKIEMDEAFREYDRARDIWEAKERAYEAEKNRVKMEKRAKCKHTSTKTKNERVFEGSGFYDADITKCCACGMVVSTKYTNVVLDSDKYR